MSGLPPDYPLRPDDLARWLGEVAPDLGQDNVQLRRMTGGSSGAVFKVTRGAAGAVLRLPAWPPREDSLKGLAREAKILAALAGTSTPHARLLAFAPDDEAIGVSAVLMSFVDGWLGSAPPPAGLTGAPARRDMAFALVEAVAQVGLVDYQAAGLGDLGRPEGFLDRQVGRWLGQLEGYRKTYDHPGRQIPGLDYVAAWLRANQPPTQRHALIHSDVGFPNVLFANDAPIRVAAIIDWEIATLGDPLLDLGRAIFTLPGRRTGVGRGRLHDYADMPTREDLAERYAELTGLDVAALDYYCVLAAFKLACIIEFNFFRLATGQDTSPGARELTAYGPEIVADAAAIARAA